jgi:hypothetical protein
MDPTLIWYQIGTKPYFEPKPIWIGHGLKNISDYIMGTVTKKKKRVLAESEVTPLIKLNEITFHLI